MLDEILECIFKILIIIAFFVTIIFLVSMIVLIAVWCKQCLVV